MDWLSVSSIVTLLLLIALELILGIDNILVISLVTERLPKALQDKARIIGLVLAAVFRLIFLALATWIMGLEEPVIEIAEFSFSWRDIILLSGGAFLLWKAVSELHHAVEGPDEEATKAPKAAGTFVKAIITIGLMDVVFSIDSVITAVGMTEHYIIMAIAVIVAVAGMIIYSGPVIRLLKQYPSLKILALSFLVCIGVTLCLEAFGTHVPKHLLYLPMGYALGVNLLQLRMRRNRERQGEAMGA
jgi:predicted tellurium resistance membrane protein TerC